MIQLAFEYFDKDRSGYITSDEFVAAMSELGDPLTEQEVATFLKHFDVDSDGKVNQPKEKTRPAPPRPATYRGSRVQGSRFLKPKIMFHSHMHGS